MPLCFGKQVGAALVEGEKFLLDNSELSFNFLHFLDGHLPQAHPPYPPPSHPMSLRHTGAADAWGAHLGEDLVKPLQRPIQVQLNPAGGAGHCLSPVFCSPAFDEAHANGAHARQLVDGLEALVDRLSQEGGKLLVVEDLQVASWWDLADRGWVPAIALVTVGGLDEDSAVAEALRKHLPSDVV